MSAILDDPVTGREILDALKEVADQLKLIRMQQEIITGQIIKVEEINED